MSQLIRGACVEEPHALASAIGMISGLRQPHADAPLITTQRRESASSLETELERRGHQLEAHTHFSLEGPLIGG